MAAEITRAKAERGGHRGVVTKTIAEMENLLRDLNLDSIDILEGNIELLKTKQHKLGEIDQNIVRMLSEEDAIQKDIEESSEYEANIYRIISKASKSLAAQARANAPPIVTSTSEVGSQYGKAKLPKLTLREFSGDVFEFSVFLETFQSSVDSNNALRAIDKFTYLRSLLKGTAAATISGLQLTAENYRVALELLQKRYGDKQVITAHLMDGLLKLEPVKRADDLSHLRAVYDKLESHLRNLKTLGINSQQYGPVMIPVILTKLTAEIRLEITRKTSGELWDFDEVYC